MFSFWFLNRKRLPEKPIVNIITSSQASVCLCYFIYQHSAACGFKNMSSSGTPKKRPVLGARARSQHEAHIIQALGWVGVGSPSQCLCLGGAAGWSCSGVSLISIRGSLCAGDPVPALAASPSRDPLRSVRSGHSGGTSRCLPSGRVTGFCADSVLLRLSSCPQGK